MVKLQQAGRYRLIETKNQIKILYLDDETYAWINAKNIGEILVSSHNPHKTDCVLSMGNYWIYDVVDEPDLSDHIHLELAVGNGRRQGYILLSGLPGPDNQRVRVIPTHELVTAKILRNDKGRKSS